MIRTKTDINASMAHFGRRSKVGSAYAYSNRRNRACFAGQSLSLRRRFRTRYALGALAPDSMSSLLHQKAAARLVPELPKSP